MEKGNFWTQLLSFFHYFSVPLKRREIERTTAIVRKAVYFYSITSTLTFQSILSLIRCNYIFKSKLQKRINEKKY